MGSAKTANSRKPASSRNTGRRKGPKSKQNNNENIAPLNETRVIASRPKARPAWKNAAQCALEDDAAAALISMAVPSATVPSTDVDVDVDDGAEVHDIELSGEDTRNDNYSPEASEEEEDKDDNDSSESSDEELDKAVKQVIPTVKIPPKFDIPFEVPYKNGTRDLTGITSRTLFDDFLHDVATKMQTRVSALNIGYIPSYRPRSSKPTPKLLEDDDSWDVLVADVQQYIKSSQGRNRGKGQVKPFSILIIDMDELQETKTKGKGGKKGAKPKKDRDDPDEPVQTPALKEHELFKKIEKEHYCQACKSACFVLDNGDHHILSHPELATWAMLASRHQALVSEPPKELGLQANHARQKKAKNHQANGAANSNDAAPGWVQALAPVLGALLNNRPPAVTPEWQQYQQNTAGVLHIPHSMQAGPSTGSMGTKRPAEDIPAPELCPDIVCSLPRH
ncbi:hypothetical protein B0H13DRAFT_1923719 [Mycena leptocephala]|nr:hypothetical protein B0H13DRAFT_1923719 [Mycena leptocephala]